jgi:hypothetical protein
VVDADGADYDAEAGGGDGASGRAQPAHQSALQQSASKSASNEMAPKAMAPRKFRGVTSYKHYFKAAIMVSHRRRLTLAPPPRLYD